MKTYFIADLHFNDANIIRFCNRPFQTVDEMNQTIISNWNNVVSRDDTVFVLGDVYTFKDFDANDYKNLDADRINYYNLVSKLKGHKRLIKGNHDTEPDDLYLSCNCFEFVSPYPIVFDNFFLLSHEPAMLSETTPYFNIYGHIHNNNKFVDNTTSKCVSAERINYTPISLDSIKKGISSC
jgi:calcineurin-like phosphoesterase family protein